MTINTAEIEARLAKATPGPWEASADGLIWHETAMTQDCCGHPRVVCDDDGAGNAVPAYEVCCGEPIVHGGQESLAQASGDNATFIAHAPDDIRDLLAALKAETARADRYAERLEITSHWVSYDDGVTLTRVEVPREDWDTQIDGIDCRDETIKLQDAAVDNLRDQLTAANEKLAAARERDLRLVEWLCCLLDEVKPDDATKAQAVKFLDAFNTGDGNGR